MIQFLQLSPSHPLSSDACKVHSAPDHHEIKGAWKTWRKGKEGQDFPSRDGGKGRKKK